MALVIGTNCGFVTTAPTADPDESFTLVIDGKMRAGKFTSPSGTIVISSMGWYQKSATITAGNFEVGIYSDNGGVPDALLFSDRVNSSGTTEGWKVVTGLDWSLDANTTYWLAVQMDAVSGFATLNNSGTGGIDAVNSGESTLVNPFNSDGESDDLVAIYAVAVGEPTGTNLQLNIADVWKAVPAVQINIGDVWKEVVGIQLNIGDTWKEVF